MEKANIPVGSIQRILGHENRKTTEIYLHGLGESERRAVEIYEKVREVSHTGDKASTIVRTNVDLFRIYSDTLMLSK